MHVYLCLVPPPSPLSFTFFVYLPCHHLFWTDFVFFVCLLSYLMYCTPYSQPTIRLFLVQKRCFFSLVSSIVLTFPLATLWHHGLQDLAIGITWRTSGTVCCKFAESSSILNFFLWSLWLDTIDGPTLTYWNFSHLIFALHIFKSNYIFFNVALRVQIFPANQICYRLQFW